MIGKHIWTEFPEGIGQPFYKAYYRAVETKQVITLEEYYPPYDRWFENRIYPSKDGLTILFNDITERKKAEQTFRDTNLYNRLLFDRSPIGLALCRMDGSLVDVNEAYAKMIGYTRDETLNLT
jgi:PAS domain-containing protein